MPDSKAAPRKAAPQIPRRRMRGFERAVTLVGRELNAPAERRGFAQTKLLTHWAEIVGPDIAAMARPVQVKYSRGMGGTLILLTTGSHAPILKMQSEQIIEKVNACYGYHAIKAVQITQTAPTGFAEGKVAFKPAETHTKRSADPARVAAVTGGLADIKDPDLREALMRLAGHIVTKTDRD